MVYHCSKFVKKSVSVVGVPEQNVMPVVVSGEKLTFDVTFSKNIDEIFHQMAGPVYQIVDLSFAKIVPLDLQMIPACDSFRAPNRLNPYFKE